jgi:DNA-binding GntR family transcriptional regulator
VRVRELTREIALELYEVRETVEGLAARLAAERVTPETIQEMEDCLSEQEKVVKAQDPIGYSQTDHRFHVLIYQVCGNTLLQEILAGLRYKALPLAFRLSPHFGEFLDFHRKILHAFRHKDGEAAEKAIRQHNRRMIDLIHETPWGVENRSPL